MKHQTTRQSTTREASSLRSQFRPKILVLDDDPIVTTIISQHLKVTFPTATVSVSNRPVVEPGFNIYFIDNDFDGEQMAASLLDDVRECAPHALVVAMSTTLNLDDLQSLVNRGCNVVYNKRRPQDSKDAQEVIEKYISILEESHLQKRKTDFIDLLRSIKELLKQWNQRLSREIPSGFSKSNNAA